MVIMSSTSSFVPSSRLNCFMSRQHRQGNAHRQRRPGGANACVPIEPIDRGSRNQRRHHRADQRRHRIRDHPVRRAFESATALLRLSTATWSASCRPLLGVHSVNTRDEVPRIPQSMSMPKVFSLRYSDERAIPRVAAACTRLPPASRSARRIASRSIDSSALSVLPEIWQQ
jgi:hypothetical protein